MTTDDRTAILEQLGIQGLLTGIGHAAVFTAALYFWYSQFAADPQTDWYRAFLVATFGGFLLTVVTLDEYWYKQDKMGWFNEENRV